MKKTFIFDLGGVFVDWNPRYFYRTIFNDDAKMEDFLARSCNTAWIVKMDAGVSFEDNLKEGQKLCPEYAKELALYSDGWSKMVGGLIEGTIEILKELKAQGHKVYALTNWSAEKFPWARQHFEFLKLFDGIVVSGEEKCIKPYPQIYNILLNRYGLKAGNCVFIDDNPPNVKAAQGLGMTGIVFKSPQDLRKEISPFLD